MANYAPIALFVYRRVALLDRVLDSLEACPEFSESEVYVFSDGPKTAAVAHDVEAVRALVRSRLKPNMRMVEASENKGLATSIIEGVTRLCNEYGRVIVFEDDLIVSPVVLTWFNNALKLYANEERVMQISGHMFDVPQIRARGKGVLLPMTTSWGWATWKRAWDMFDTNASGWEQITVDGRIRRRFDLNGAYPYGRMLQRQMRGEIDSWAIRWYWSVFLVNGLALFPPQSMVRNDGEDIQATHGSRRGLLNLRSKKAPMLCFGEIEIPTDVVMNRHAYRYVQMAIGRSRLPYFYKIREKVGDFLLFIKFGRSGEAV